MWIITNKSTHVRSQLRDVLLRDVAVRLQDCIRENDVVVRVGGDDFVLLVTTLQHKRDVIPVAEKIVSRLSEAFKCDSQVLKNNGQCRISF